MTYFDKLKYDNFVNDTDGYFEKTRVINFGIIHKQVEEEQVEVDLFKKYNTMDHSRLQFYPEKESILEKIAEVVVNKFDVCHKFLNDLERHCRHIDCCTNLQRIL